MEKRDYVWNFRVDFITVLVLDTFNCQTFPMNNHLWTFLPLRKNTHLTCTWCSHHRHFEINKPFSPGRLEGFSNSWVEPWTNGYISWVECSHKREQCYPMLRFYYFFNPCSIYTRYTKITSYNTESQHLHALEYFAPLLMTKWKSTCMIQEWPIERSIFSNFKRIWNFLHK